jgi:hypothetical protein
MTIVRLGITMSADGYVAGPNQSLERPLAVAHFKYRLDRSIS